MEDQGKRLMLAVAIAFGIMMLWQVLFPPPAKPEKKSEDDKAAETAKVDKEKSETEKLADSPEGKAEEEAAKARGEEVFYDFNFDDVQARFSSYGGGLVSWKLLGDRLENREIGAPEDLIRVQGENHAFPRVWFEDSDINIPASAEWKGEKRSDNEMVFVWEGKGLRVTKSFRLHPQSYSFKLDVKAELVGADVATQALAVSLYSQQDLSAEGGGTFDRVERIWKAACYQDEEIKTRTVKKLNKSGPKKRLGDISWGGFDHAYFLVAGGFKYEGDVNCNAYALAGVEGGMRLDMVQGRVELGAETPPLTGEMVVYLGPKYGDALVAADKVADFNPHFSEAVDLGWLGLIAGPLLALLNFFQSYVVNWGIAILLLTVVVKLLTLPWTHKSMKSMKSMSRLKPQLEKIKEKYKDDRQRQNIETMNLFKENKVNPMAGCLPMLLQMPIWFALYRSLTVAGELYQAPFIEGWIDDLTLPDPFYIMPIALTGMMFLQTRLTPSTGTGAQQKMLMYGMPIMFGVFSFFFPAGLTLYIFTNTLFTAAHHLYMHKSDPVDSAEKASVKSEMIDADGEEVEAGRSTGKGMAPNANKKNPGKSGKKKNKSKGKKRR